MAEEADKKVENSVEAPASEVVQPQPVADEGRQPAADPLPGKPRLFLRKMIRMTTCCRIRPEPRSDGQGKGGRASLYSGGEKAYNGRWRNVPENEKGGTG